MAGAVYHSSAVSMPWPAIRQRGGGGVVSGAQGASSSRTAAEHAGRTRANETDPEEVGPKSSFEPQVVHFWLCRLQKVHDRGLAGAVPHWDKRRMHP